MAPKTNEFTTVTLPKPTIYSDYCRVAITLQSRVPPPRLSESLPQNTATTTSMEVIRHLYSSKEINRDAAPIPGNAAIAVIAVGVFVGLLLFLRLLSLAFYRVRQYLFLRRESKRVPFVDLSPDPMQQVLCLETEWKPRFIRQKENYIRPRLRQRQVISSLVAEKDWLVVATAHRWPVPVPLLPLNRMMRVS